MTIGSLNRKDTGDHIHDVARKITVPGQPTWVMPGNEGKTRYSCRWWGENRKHRPGTSDNAYCGYVLQVMGMRAPASLGPETRACPKYEEAPRRPRKGREKS